MSACAIEAYSPPRKRVWDRFLFERRQLQVAFERLLSVEPNYDYYYGVYEDRSSPGLWVVYDVPQGLKPILRGTCAQIEKVLTDLYEKVSSGL